MALDSAKTSSGNVQGITRIAVTGFKSLATKTDLEIRPLTVLAGANSSGKSSLMQPLLLMKQTLESDVDPAGPFLLSGPYPNTKYTEAAQFLSRMGGHASPQLVLDFRFGGDWTAGLTYAIDEEGSFELVETRGSIGPTENKWTISSGSTSTELKSLFGKIWFPLSWKESEESITLSAVRTKFYHSIRASTPELQPAGLTPNVMSEIKSLTAEVSRLLYVPGLRGNQDREWVLTDIPTQGAFKGPFERYVPSLIDYWRRTNKAKQNLELYYALNDVLELSQGIATVRLNESQVAVRVKRTIHSIIGDYVDIADVGLAVSTVLPVLVALIQADPGQLVYIEQPELHLHPRAQWKLAQLLAQAANGGVRLVIETHSSLLLRGILTEVAESKIANDKVILHWFERDKETGISKVHPAIPDSAGRVGDWPEDFSDVELKSDNQYLDAAEKKLFAEAK